MVILAQQNFWVAGLPLTINIKSENRYERESELNSSKNCCSCSFLDFQITADQVKR